MEKNSLRKTKKSTKEVSKVRHAGHFVDSKLQYECKAEKLTSLFDDLSLATKEKIEKSNITIKAFGIKLTPSEDKLLNAIYKLLHDKSENKDVNSEHFYSGNEASQVVAYGGNDQKAKSTTLRIKPIELYKEYMGEEECSGKDIINIKKILFGLCEKKFLIRYDRKRQVKIKDVWENRTDRIEDFQSLVQVVSYLEDMTDKEVRSLNSGDPSVREKKQEVIIALNPVLTDQN